MGKTLPLFSLLIDAQGNSNWPGEVNRIIIEGARKAMMIVYILEEHIPYEGFNIVGVFASKELAIEALNKVQFTKNSIQTITEHIINTIDLNYQE